MQVTRNYKVLTLSEDGRQLNLLINIAVDISKDNYFHSQSLYQEIVKKFGYVPVPFRVNGVNETLVKEAMIPSWEHYCQWQADCITGFMADNAYCMIFSHFHTVDSMGHMMWHYAKYQDEWGNNEVAYQAFFKEIYAQTDRYIARFLPFLDQG